MLPESELILNPDGSVYHLHLRPEHLAPIVITVGDPERVSSVSRHFDRIESKVRKREFVTQTGWLGKTRLTVISTGIGTDNIDIVLNELDALVSIDLKTRQLLPAPGKLTIVRLGTSGSIQAAVPVDSLLVSSGAFGMDGLLRFYCKPDHELCKNARLDAFARTAESLGGIPALPYFASADRGLVKVFDDGFYRGITATNTGFYAPQGRQLRAKNAVPEFMKILQSFEYQGERITNLEMETSAIYGLSHILGHRAVSLNAILANRADGTFSRNPKKTINRLIEIALEKIGLGLLCLD